MSNDWWVQNRDQLLNSNATESTLKQNWFITFKYNFVSLRWKWSEGKTLSRMHHAWQIGTWDCTIIVHHRLLSSPYCTRQLVKKIQIFHTYNYALYTPKDRIAKHNEFFSSTKWLKSKNSQFSLRHIKMLFKCLLLMVSIHI